MINTVCNSRGRSATQQRLKAAPVERLCDTITNQQSSDKRGNIAMIQRRLTAVILLILFLQSPLLLAQGARGVVFVSGGESSTEQDQWDGTDTGLKLGTGIKISDTAGVEFYWIGFGKATDTINNTTTVEGEAKALSGQFVYRVPVGGSFDLFAKLGIAFWQTDIKMEGSPKLEDDGKDPIFTLGAEFRFTHSIGARIEWDYAEFEDTELTLVTAGAVFYMD
jgi:hypothetical protein